MRNLGRAEPIYPLLERCPECGKAQPGPAADPGIPAHWPECSRAAPEARRLWSRREELRALRTATRLESATESHGEPF